jgi:hypothetical protein
MRHVCRLRFVTAFLVVTLVPALAGFTPAPAELKVRVLSSRPDMVSGGDALIRIDVPAELTLRDVRVMLNTADVTSAFRADERTRTLTGLVQGLKDGANVLTVSAAGSVSAPAFTKLTLTNHPITGPVFAGPKELPFICETEHFQLQAGGTLGRSLDASCSVATRVDYLYRSSAAPQLKPLPDPKTLPADISRATTLDGRSVPYVVRIETGTLNRAVYQIAILHDASSEPVPSFTAQPAGWNRRLIFTFGGGCMGGWNKQGRNTGGVDDDVKLRQGYAVASSSLNVHGTNCDDVLAAETMMMVKERFIEAYGEPRFTIGMGCSGGSYQQLQIADNYPGLLDGIIPGCSFPDAAFSPVPAITDARLLNRYFTSLASMPYSDDQRRAIVGVANLAWMTFMDKAHAGRITVGEFCPLPSELRYHATTNPKGARCNLYDHVVNVYGRDPQTGFARRPLDNIGIQYGLDALNEGVISKEQFLDLNEKIGGYDRDGHTAARRTVADLAAVRAAYRTGRLLNGGGGLATTPIIDYRAYQDDVPTGNPHLRYQSFATRARLQKANGYVDNQIMLTEDLRAGGYSTRSTVLREALAQMDRWLTRLTDDTSSDPKIVKLRRAKPADLVDACWSRDAIAKKIVEKQEYRAGRCNDLYPSSSFPRGVAGAAVTTDIIKCQLKPIDPSDYRVAFTAEETLRLRKILPDGVCDWSRPGVAQEGLAGTWLKYDQGEPAL